MFESEFLTDRPVSRDAYREAIGQAVATLLENWPELPYCGRSPAELRLLFDDDPCPLEGRGLGAFLPRLGDVVRNSVIVSHPHTAAHLHCPPLIAALAAEVVLSALNQSMDSFDQAPAATILEQSMVGWLCRRAGLPATADGTFTAGGTQSNFMGLLLARDSYCHERWGWSVRVRGLPPGARRFRIVCSEAAHFTIEKSAAQLGLGTDAVVKVAVDAESRMCPERLRSILDDLRRRELLPIAIVATAGTTDCGAIDPLIEVSDAARACRAWLHVDAAYGGALLFSDRLSSRLEGIERADSITMDFHKLLWQPVSCGAFLVRDASHFDLMRLHADYLNPEDHEELGIPNLVTRSILTTRRFDALKLWVTLQVMGRNKLGAMIERTLELAGQAAEAIGERPRLELIHPPRLGCLLFRYRSEDPAASDAINEQLRRRLLDEGVAVVGQARHRGRTCLKLTLLNPCLGRHEFDDLLGLIESRGTLLERSLEPCGAVTNPT